MSSRGGRPKDSVRMSFNPIEQNGKLIKMQCKMCKGWVSNKPERLRNHLKKCLGMPALYVISEQSQVLQQSQKRPIGDTTSDDEPHHIGVTNEDLAASSLLSPVKKGKLLQLDQGTPSEFVVETSSDCDSNLDLMVAKMFYANGMSFEIVDDKHFKNAISALRPGYTCPTRYDMGNKLLDQVYDQEQETARNILQGCTTTLMQNGCSNSQNDTIVTHCIHSGKEVVYLNVVDTETIEKNAEYFIDLAKEAILLAEGQYGCKVKSLVTDSEQEIEKMQANLESDDILTYVCSTHYLDLLGKDIELELGTSDTMKHIAKVQNYFKNHRRTEGLLKEGTADTAKLEASQGDTRWNSNCLEQFLRNRQTYLEIAASHPTEVDKRIVDIVESYSQYKELKDVMSLQAQLKRIVEGINKLQSISGTIADACEVWTDLYNNVELYQHKNKVEDRLNQALTPVHYLAHMLHPKYQGAKLNYDSENKATDWLATKYNPDFVAYLLAFKSRENPFPKTMFLPAVIEKTLPSVWWKSLKKAPIDPSFLQFVTEIMTFPANSVGLDKIFSNFSFDHSKISSMFGDDKTFKLVYCYQMLNKGKFSENDS